MSIKTMVVLQVGLSVCVGIHVCLGFGFCVDVVVIRFTIRVFLLEVFDDWILGISYVFFLRVGFRLNEMSMLGENNTTLIIIFNFRLSISVRLTQPEITLMNAFHRESRAAENFCAGWLGRLNLNLW